MQAAARVLQFYISIDYDWLDHPQVIALKGAPFKTLMYLMRYKDGKQLNGWTIPIAQATLADKVGCTEKSLRKYLQVLKDAGFIKSKDTKKRVYQTDNTTRESLPRKSVNITHISNISLNNITKSPQTPHKVQDKREKGGKEELFKEIKEALREKDDSPIPSDTILHGILAQVPADQPQQALAYAIRRTTEPQIKNLRKFLHAGGPFSELVRSYQGNADSKRRVERSRELLRKTRGPDQTKRQPERVRE